MAEVNRALTAINSLLFFVSVVVACLSEHPLPFSEISVFGVKSETGSFLFSSKRKKKTGKKMNESNVQNGYLCNMTYI